MINRFRHSYFEFAVVAMSALLAVSPMLVYGPSCGHDFDFHLLSWLEAATQFAHFGYPHWAFTPAFNAGEPRFVFYPPLSWTLGAVLGLVLPWTLVPAAFTWVALTLSGLTMHRFARRHVSPNAALFAAVFYLANPYMLFAAYERTAYGELLAAAWLPLLFAAALAPRVRILPIASAVALLWLTNAPAAVMSCYALAFLTAVRLAVAYIQPNTRHPERGEGPLYFVGPGTAVDESPHPARWHLALIASTGTLLGVALSAFYLLPAAYERRFVQIDRAVMPGMRIADHFLFHRMAPTSADNSFHDAVVRTASLIALILIAAIAAAVVATWRGRPPFVLPSLLLTMLIAFLLTPPSLPIWTHVPELQFLQFPWRLTALLGVLFAITLALAIDRLPPFPSSLLPPGVPGVRSLLAGVALPFLFLILPAWHLFHQRCDLEDSVPARVALFHSSLGTEPTDEYTPVGADPDALNPRDPPIWLLPSTADANTPAPSPLPPGQAPGHLTLDLTSREILILNRRRFPLWQVLVNHVPAPLLKRDDGLIAVALPPGSDTIDLVPIRPRDRTAGLAISLLAALAAFTLRRAKFQAID